MLHNARTSRLRNEKDGPPVRLPAPFASSGCAPIFPSLSIDWHW